MKFVMLLRHIEINTKYDDMIASFLPPLVFEKQNCVLANPGNKSCGKKYTIFPGYKNNLERVLAK